MLNQNTHQTSQKLFNSVMLVFLLLVVALIVGCKQNRSDDFVKLEEPLKDVLPKITLIAPEEKDKDGKPLEITVGSEFKGEGEYSIGGGETHKFRYTFLSQYAVEGNKYIYAVVSYNWGGSGNFYYLTAIDKTTLKSVSQFFLGDRVKIESVGFKMDPFDTVSVSYKERETGTPMAAPPDKLVEMDFLMHENQLTDFKSLDKKK